MKIFILSLILIVALFSCEKEEIKNNEHFVIIKNVSSYYIKILQVNNLNNGTLLLYDQNDTFKIDTDSFMLNYKKTGEFLSGSESIFNFHCQLNLDTTILLIDNYCIYQVY